MPAQVLSPKNRTFALGDLVPHLIHGSLVQISNGISIDSAVFAQLTAEYRYTLQRAASFPLKLPLPWVHMDPHITHDSAGLSEPRTQTLLGNESHHF